MIRANAVIIASSVSALRIGAPAFQLLPGNEVMAWLMRHHELTLVGVSIKVLDRRGERKCVAH
jgi:hypothetical protein